MDASDIVISNGEKRASDVDELECVVTNQRVQVKVIWVPHPHIILHHELVDSFGWMGHVNLSCSISEVCLVWVRIEFIGHLLEN